jgi:hypothetical protein
VSEAVRFTLLLGALAPPRAEQLEGAGFSFKANQIRRLQGDADAIARLAVRRLLSESEVAKAGKRLAKRVAHAVTTKGSRS